MTSAASAEPQIDNLDVFRPELHAFVYRAVFEIADEVIGTQHVDQVLARYGVRRAQLQDPEAWVSLAFSQAFLDDLYRKAGDPQFFTRVARLVLTPRYLGPRYAFLRAFGNPMSTFMLIAKTVGTMNRTGTYDADRTSDRSCVLTFVPVPGIVRETTPHMCRIRMVMIASVPTLFDLPPAHVEHPTCMARGDSVCTYQVSWIPHRSKNLPWFGAGIGGLAGLAYVWMLHSGTWMAWLGIAAAAIGGWAFGTSLRLRRELVERTRDITTEQDALETSLLNHQTRFSELLEAKREVDQKVEQRTSELSQATKQLSDTLTSVQELDRAKTDFFNNVSHELRSPLTLILAPLEELMAGRPPPGGHQIAYDTMHRNASRLLQLINQLLDLAKIDAGEMRIAVSPTQLRSLAETCVERFKTAAAKKGVRLSLDAPAQMEPVPIDATWIDSAVSNLMANALRLTNSGGGVRVIVTDLGRWVSVAVSDDGPGIAPADQQRVFERFAQGDSTKRVIGGTGIGLALVREAARLHGGEVELASELGKGSTFTIKLPRQKGMSQLPPPVERTQPSLAPPRGLIEESRAELENSERPGPTRDAPLVLVVEDNPELRAFLADVLAPQYRVRTAKNGHEGYELAGRLKPDTIVSDVAMPEMDGYELCRRLRADDATKTLPVLMVTARTDMNSVLEGFTAGANDYLMKPFHATELLARVGVHVRLRRLTAQLARQERLAALGSLAASMAHNVRNPLSALISGLPAIRGRLAASLDQSSNEMMGIMLNCAERIERMTIDLLDLSRIDRETSGEFAPGAGLLACTRMLQSRVAPGVHVHTEVDESAVAVGRAGDMNHVFMNVIDNALRAVEDSGKIEVRGVVERDHYVVTIGDSGAGVDQAVADQIFEPFWTTRAAGEGTGLGLSIGRQIVEEHGGTITVDKSPLGGAQFVVRLPLRASGQRAVA